MCRYITNNIQRLRALLYSGFCVCSGWMFNEQQTDYDKCLMSIIFLSVNMVLPAHDWNWNED